MTDIRSYYQGEIVQPLDSGKPTHLVVSKNLPEHIREDYPQLVTFIEAYYKYLDGTHTGQLDKIKDIDVVSSEFLNAYRNQFAPNIPEFDYLRTREFIKHAKEFYTSKGTESSVRFLFQLLFAEDVIIEYPGEQILRASDGKWHQEFFVTIQSISNTPPPTPPFNFYFENTSGKYNVTITRIEEVSSGAFRLFYEKNSPSVVMEGQLFYNFNETGDIVFAGQVIRSPAKLKIETGGRDWQQGQIIVIPGTIKNTVARVTRISSIGTIMNLEILEYGVGHTENQITIISPYPSKPTSSTVTVEKQLTSVGPNRYTYHLNISDTMEGFRESIRGVTEDNSVYVIGDYVTQGYLGEQVLVSLSSTTPTPENQFNEISLQRWLDSRATLVFAYDTSVKTRGTYTSEDGLISNSNIFLQDNYFYQAFSYLIETGHDSKDFESALRLTHPAGMQWFSNFRKEFNWDSMNVVAERSMSQDKLLLRDTFDFSDFPATKNVSKKLSDTVSIVDTIGKTVNKYITGDVITIDDDHTTSITATTYNASDYFSESYAIITHGITI